MQNPVVQIRRFQTEQDYEYLRWINQIPALRFSPNWDITIIPPYNGAIVRFTIDKPDRHLSVLLDCYGELNHQEIEPYWEVYCTQTNEVARFKLKDIASLQKKICEMMNNK